jgi:hypothetical protein
LHLRHATFLFCALLAAKDVVDHDRDGIDDRLEQELLVRFAPAFHVSANECDVLPAEFTPDVADPRVRARNGTIYGRVTPARVGADRHGAFFVEIQYFHLWSRDCGRLLAHELDAEHVSALVGADSLKRPVKHWRAVHWYAGAHEDTLCENSAGIAAATIGAEQAGPYVWISKGKHASYLTLRRCAQGCRADDCDNSERMRVHQIINLGEPGWALNGAVWVSSPRWNLNAKLLKSDFSPETVAELDRNGMLNRRGLRPVKEIVGAGSDTSGAVGTANRHTRHSVRESFRLATEKTARFLGLR